jgi:hypothetical protein
MKLNETKMDGDVLAVSPQPNDRSEGDGQPAIDPTAKLRSEFQTRLIVANLRTEAVRAGMVDLDGLKLIDLSDVHLDENDDVVGGRKMMTELRRMKPWLFGAASTSSAAAVPTSQPVRQRTAMDMTDEEYAAARTAVTRYQF